MFTFRKYAAQSTVPPTDDYTKSDDKNKKSESDSASNANYEEEIRKRILDASLNHVKQLGWSKEALIAGAEDVGYPGVTHGMFTRGGADLVLHFQKSSNNKLVELLKEYRKTVKIEEITPVQFVEHACKERLTMIIPYISKWPQAIALMALPPNMPAALATVLTMVDDICYHAGDRSVDFNWYARRLGVAGVYKASELYLIQDKSPEYAETWKFLNRRLNDALQVQQVIEKSEGVGQGAKDAITATFTTARNILGLNKV